MKATNVMDAKWNPSLALDIIALTPVAMMIMIYAKTVFASSATIMNSNNWVIT